MARLLQLILVAVSLTTALNGCVPVVAGGAVAGGLAASDRRTSGAYVDDEGIEWKTGGEISKILMVRSGAAASRDHRDGLQRRHARRAQLRASPLGVDELRRGQRFTAAA